MTFLSTSIFISILFMVLPGCTLLSANQVESTTRIEHIGNTPAEGWEKCTLKRVVDGDTIEVQCSTNIETIRLCGVDTYERGQEYGKQATQLTVEFLRAPEVLINRRDVDRYGRIVADIGKTNTDGSIDSLGVELITEGFAVLYHQYYQGCTNPDKLYEASRTSEPLGSIDPQDYRRNR